MTQPKIAFVLLSFLLAPAACGQEDVPPPGRQDPLAEMQRLFEENGITVDPKAGTITIRTEVGRPDQPLEFLLIHRKGKAHEAVFITEAKGSVLNAAFIALGYQKGQNARIVDRDPLPTPEEIEKGAPLFDVFPPKGMQVWFTARWKKIDADGNEVEVHVPVEDMLVDMTTDSTVEGNEWIYLGGNMAPLYRDEPPVFVADFEGNYVSIVYKSPPNHLVTMKHERANDDQIWWVSDLVPRTGTEVELIAHRNKTKLHIERDARIAARKKAAEKDGESGR